MSRFYVYSARKAPCLHLWREGMTGGTPVTPVAGAAPGWFTFEYALEPSPVRVGIKLCSAGDGGEVVDWEVDCFNRFLAPDEHGLLPDEVWFSEGACRVLTRDPNTASAATVRIHLISARRYRPCQIFLWCPGEVGRRADMSGMDAAGPYFDVSLAEDLRRFFLFKFIRRDDAGAPFDRFEPDFANRVWSSTDGGTLWTHSELAEVAIAEPVRKRLRVHVRSEAHAPAELHVWQENSDFEANLPAVSTGADWATYTVELYTRLNYGLLLHRPVPGQPAQGWEHPEAKRMLSIADDHELWTLEGDRTTFTSRPARTRPVSLTVAARPPGAGTRPAHVRVWVNRATDPLAADLPVDRRGRVSFKTYPGVVTSVQFVDATGRPEACARHPLPDDGGTGTVRRYVVLDRPSLLRAKPPAGVYADPPFVIRRPGAYVEDGHLHVVVHAPAAARVRLEGAWTPGRPLEMHCTLDGAYWWTRVPIADVLGGLGQDRYHGAGYRFIFNDDQRLQDPAAGWVTTSYNGDWSRLVQSERFTWTDAAWSRPGWEYLTIYQVHAARFSNRHQGEPPLRQVTRELDSSAAYLRELGVTALLLLPVNEVGTHHSWGYDPAFFYAVENDLGGPDALKELVDTCHRHGLAVLLDVEFNHGGTIDNILWEVARESFFDGDTRWGAMINFDHPQCRHFFARNLVYLAEEYHIDGFRLDHTATIIHSAAWDGWSSYVRELGSGGGWEFLHELRRALVAAVGDRCLLMGEHLPNEWSVTNFGGPLDTQWCDDFHDTLVKACRRDFGVMPQVASALRLGHTHCDQWYNVTNYHESHDEVGNVRDRVAWLGGFGQGWRMCKVAGAATLLARGIPMYFMGAESCEDAQFTFGATTPLDLDRYQADPDRGRVRAWYRVLAELRRGNSCLAGPAPLVVRHADGQLLAFTRGEGSDYFVLLNFGGWSGTRSLASLGAGDGIYRELWNSTWPAFAVLCEAEGEHTNGGRDAWLGTQSDLNVPDCGVLVLERRG
ncbi:MAG: hypothetical protein IAE82_18535 [Opitutaceae bacterium]|nr:hypothetical protein [Opitutaceae bacterium]